MRADEWAVTPLGPAHDRESFRSGSDTLDDFLRKFASQNARKNLTRTYVATRDGSTAVSGYYALRMGEVDGDALPEAERRRLPRYPLPVVHLARLAVDERARGKRLGELLLLDAFDRSVRLADSIGPAAIEVIAKDDAASSFYRKYGFRELLDTERHLYLSMKVIRKALR